jgi:hypothetical protein
MYHEGRKNRQGSSGVELRPKAESLMIPSSVHLHMFWLDGSEKQNRSLNKNMFTYIFVIKNDRK